MANSASDARSSEQEIRRQIVEARAVDVIVAVGPNMFYTVTLPCTLWFFDRGKSRTARKDQTLFVDARHVYRQIDRAHRDWSPAQIGFIGNLVRFWRGEALDFTMGGEDGIGGRRHNDGRRGDRGWIAGVHDATVHVTSTRGGRLRCPGRRLSARAGRQMPSPSMQPEGSTTGGK